MELDRRTVGFALPDKANIGGAAQDIHWKFKGATQDNADGQKLTIRFVCETPSLELKSAWWARPGGGPVQHTMRITNRSQQPLTLSEQPTIHLDIAGRTDDGALSMWTFHSDGATPDKTGVYRNAVEPAFYRQVRTDPDGKFIPYAVFDAGGKTWRVHRHRVELLPHRGRCRRRSQTGRSAGPRRGIRGIQDQHCPRRDLRDAAGLRRRLPGRRGRCGQ